MRSLRARFGRANLARPAATTPTCATGPVGRLVFVGRELRDGLRSWRRRRFEEGRR